MNLQHYALLVRRHARRRTVMLAAETGSDAQLADAARRILEPTPLELAYSAEPLSEEGIEPVCFLWKPYIPQGTITIVAGDPDAGKSLMMIDIVARLTTGEPLPGETEKTREPMVVTWLTREESVSKTLTPRLMAAGADIRRVHTLPRDQMARPDSDVTNPKFLAWLTEQCRRSFVVVDPLQDILSKTLDMNNPRAMRVALEPLTNLVYDTAGFVAIAHNRKSKTRNAKDNLAGSGQQVAAVRSVISVFCERGDDGGPPRHYMAHAKSNLSVKGVTRTYRVEGVPFAEIAELCGVAAPTDAGSIGRIEWTGEDDRDADTLAARQASVIDPDTINARDRDDGLWFIEQCVEALDAGLLPELRSPDNVSAEWLTKVADSCAELPSGRKMAGKMVWKLLNATQTPIPRTDSGRPRKARFPGVKNPTQFRLISDLRRAAEG